MILTGRSPVYGRHRSSSESPRLQFGINTNSWERPPNWPEFKIYGDRSFNLDQLYTVAPETFSKYVGESIAKGCMPLPIINTPGASKLSAVNAATFAADAIKIIEKIVSQHPTVKVFELINEPYAKGGFSSGSGSSIASYAAIIKATFEELDASGLSGITLLPYLWSKEWNGDWIKGLYEGLGSAVAAKVKGFVGHPYGSSTAAAVGSDFNFKVMKEWHERAVAAGFPLAATNNLWISEVGWMVTATPKEAQEVKTTAEQKKELENALKEALIWHEEGWLQAFFVYRAGSDGWGINHPAENPTAAAYTAFATAHG